MIVLFERVVVDCGCRKDSSFWGDIIRVSGVCEELHLIMVNYSGTGDKTPGSFLCRCLFEMGSKITMLFVLCNSS